MERYAFIFGWKFAGSLLETVYEYRQQVCDPQVPRDNSVEREPMFLEARLAIAPPVVVVFAPFDLRDLAAFNFSPLSSPVNLRLSTLRAKMKFFLLLRLSRRPFRPYKLLFLCSKGKRSSLAPSRHRHRG